MQFTHYYANVYINMTMTQEPSAAIPELSGIGVELLRASPEARDMLPDISFASPLLTALHNRKRGQMAEFHALPGSGLPTEPVQLKPYYFNSQDHNQLGIWKLDQRDHATVFVHSDLPYGEEDPELKGKPRICLSRSMKVVYGPFSEDRLDLDREAQVVELLRFAADKFSAAEAARIQASAEERNTHHRHLGRLFLPRQHRPSK